MFAKKTLDWIAALELQHVRRSINHLFLFAKFLQYSIRCETEVQGLLCSIIVRHVPYVMNYSYMVPTAGHRRRRRWWKFGGSIEAT